MTGHTNSDFNRTKLILQVGVLLFAFEVREDGKFSHVQPPSITLFASKPLTLNLQAPLLASNCYIRAVSLFCCWQEQQWILVLCDCGSNTTHAGNVGDDKINCNLSYFCGFT